MTLASSGYIDLKGGTQGRSVATELGNSGSQSLVSAETRTLTGKSSGSITMPDDFYGRSSYTFSVNVPQDAFGANHQFYNAGDYGFVTQSFAQLEYGSTGVLYWVEGDNSQYFPGTYETDSWINSVPDGGDRSSVTANYDFEWEFVQGDTDNGTTYAVSGQVQINKTHTISPPFGTRVNLGTNSPIIVRQVEILTTYANGYTDGSFIQVRAKIYQAGTNNIVSNVLHGFILDATYGPPA